MCSADCQDVGHLKARRKNSFSFCWIKFFSRPDFPSVVQIFTKIKKEKNAICDLVHVRIPAKLDIQLDWMVPCCMYKKQTQFSLRTPTMKVLSRFNLYGSYDTLLMQIENTLMWLLRCNSWSGSSLFGLVIKLLFRCTGNHGSSVG